VPELLSTPTGEAISEYIQSMIFDGTLKSGARIDREQIAADVGTSQIPVREALLRLEAEGAIVIEPHRGAFVAPTDEESVREHWELMGFITGMAAAKVARRQDPEVFAELESLLVELNEADDPETFNPVAVRLVRLIHLEGATPKLRNLMRQFSRQVPGNFYVRIPGSMEGARIGYERLVKAIGSGDEESARLAAADYMRKQGDLVSVVLRANGVIPPSDTGG
jgi:DNA-binding GntR family transcriptional regulator